MYKNILIATDGSELADKALDQGLALAKALGARACIVHVTEPWSTYVTGEAAMVFPFEEYEKAVAGNANEILTKAGEAARRAGVTSETLHVKDRHPAEGILETAAARGSELIVMASHGRRGLGRLILGSQANDVVTQSVVPVLICR